MKNSTLWYLSPIAFALLAVSWVSQTHFTAGSFDQSTAMRTIQSDQGQPMQHSLNAHCGNNHLVEYEFDENTTSPARHMGTSAHSQCPRI
jgi:hypothetical protein